MDSSTISTAIRIIARTAILALMALFAWVYVLPSLQMRWDMTFPHYDHEITVLPFDVECTFIEDGGESLRLPKGTMLYSPCKHDFSRMSLDETCTYKIYVRLSPDTIKGLIKDNDETRHEEFMRIKRRGTIVECKNVRRDK